MLPFQNWDSLPPKVKLALSHCDISLPAAELGVLYTVPLADTFCVDAPVEAHVIFPLGVSEAPLATNADANLIPVNICS